MRVFHGLWGLAAMASAAAPASADAIVLYDFGDGTQTLAAAVDPVATDHITAGTFGDRKDLLGWSDIGNIAPPLSEGVARINGLTDAIDTTNAFTFEVQVEGGWELALDGWSVSIWMGSTGNTDIHMLVETLAADGSAASTQTWGWFVVSQAIPFSTEGAHFGEEPGSIVLAGGQTYRFSLAALNPENKTVYLDNVALNGQVRQAETMPEPGSLALLSAGAGLMGLRGCRGQWSGRPCA